LLTIVQFKPGKGLHESKMYSYASSSHILQYQGPILWVCSAHPIKLIVT